MMDPLTRSRSSPRRALALVFCAASGAAGQAAPSTDIHLAALRVREGVATVAPAQNITAHVGYDNQPAFTPDGRSILFTSVRDGGQSDIYRYEIETRRTVQVTRTPESEYSATVMPGGRRISVIRVEADSAQRLWSFATDGTDPLLVLRDVKPVGYHAWANDSTLALFVLGSPATLQVANARTGSARTIVGGIGRSLHRIPGGQAISFVDKQSPTEWWIKRLDPMHDSPTPMVMTLPGSEDYAWLPDGSALMARGNTLYRWVPASGRASPAPRAATTASTPSSPPAGSGAISTEWTAIARFTEPSLQRITRLAVSPAGDWLALVSAEPARP